MSCPDPLHDYEDWIDEDGDTWMVGYDDHEDDELEDLSGEEEFA